MSDPVALASDHAGFDYKIALIDFLRSRDIAVQDLGAHGPDSVDYPDYGQALGAYVAAEPGRMGVAICGSGIGISIAANRIRGARAALVWSVEAAKLARQHNDANIIALGARLLPLDVAKECLDVFLTTGFEGGRHARRVAKLDQ